MADAKEIKDPMAANQTCSWHDGHQHQWIDEPGDWDLGGERSYVVCSKCGVPGERDDVTGEVYWPAT